jgi:hypothetical protein
MFSQPFGIIWLAWVVAATRRNFKLAPWLSCGCVAWKATMPYAALHF